MKNITKTLIAASLAVIIASSMTACNGDGNGNGNSNDLLILDNQLYDIASVGINSVDLKSVAEKNGVPEPQLPDGAELLSIEQSKNAQNPTFNLQVKQTVNETEVQYELQIIILPQNSETKDTDIETADYTSVWTQNRTTYIVTASIYAEEIAESVKAAN